MIHTLIVFHLVLKTSNKIILCPGLPRSGTTSLWHMLKKAKFLNSPCKEPHFLTVLSDDKTDSPTFFPEEFKNRYHQYVYDLNREIRSVTLKMCEIGNKYEIEPPPIYLHINSYGGSIFSAFSTFLPNNEAASLPSI